MPFAAALSVHPVSSHATGELIGQVIEELGSGPDVALLLASPSHAGALEDVGVTVRRLLRPGLLVGATVPALAGQGADERGGSALGLWAGFTGPVVPLRYPGTPAAPGTAVAAAARLRGSASGAVLLGRPPPRGSADRGDLDAWLADLGAQVPVAGALSPSGPLLIGDELMGSGVVGVAFGPEIGFDVVRAPGWRAIGPELVVTESDPDRGLILTLDGAPALDRLRRVATDEVPAEEIGSINRRLGIGSSPAATVEVAGGDRSNGAIAAGPLAEGSRVHFWVTADPAADLRRALSEHRRDSPEPPATALVFSADPLVRGYQVDPAAARPATDAAVLSDVLGIDRLIGAVAIGQISSGGSPADGLRVGRAEATVAFLSERQ